MQDQWKKKKQTKEQAAAARRAKLDPDSAKSAKDIMDERARKRKLAEAVQDAEESDVEGIEKEQPKQGLKIPQEKKVKKQKTLEHTDETPQKDQDSKDISEDKQLKQERKKEKKEKKAQKLAEKKQKHAAQKVELPAEEIATEPTTHHAERQTEPQVTETVELHEEDNISDDMEAIEVGGLEEQPEDEITSQSSPPSPTFDQPSPAEPSANTSTSSTIPPAQKPKHIKLPSDPELLRARLAARIEALRAARKADGPDGHPARNRAELMEARRQKEEQRKAHKKELRAKARLEEEEKREAALASARDSPASSLMSPAIHSPDHNFSFGRVNFADGQQLSADLSPIQATPRKRGPQDAATAIAASEKKAARIAGLDEEKRTDIEEKELWLNAKKKAHGEKVRDDTNLLKKTLKRKEKMKAKSSKEWIERKEGVEKGIALKQKKREANLQKRIDGKGVKGKKKSGGNGKKPKARPGFEGSFGGKRK